ncbi:non-ribosomal peptide synthetase [Paenibacillus sp. MMS18-CY102]|uniref:non-ribosomal peptide synthetase n=1 Tax=Paenibacillus sp. MMS18-CY102 TaxID=2682849 RepID=UPI0013651E44|nr:non-ribosomal peptide synthetase [Paenibacillus sp. MMS18-CY102]MWC29596.1 amino acid adenylation domain-containing protein [Paenibacillus sp. MMS18-CY102]
MKLEEGLNATARQLASICELFQQTVERNPDAVCITQGEDLYTYRQIDGKSNQLAHYLIQKGVARDSIIGIYQDRSPDMVVSMLAVLKAGAAYVPLTSAYPAERIAHIIKETKLSILLTSSKLEETVAECKHEASLQCISLDSEWHQVQQESSTRPSVRPAASDLAYVIYTSGSTGKPKGVMIEHRGLPNLVQEQIAAFQLNEQDRVLQYAAFTFDASVSEILTTLVAGAALVLLPQEGTFVGEELYQYMIEQEISVVTLTPSVLATLSQNDLPALKTIVSAGEACTKKLVHYWSSKVNLVNAYGPSEATVCATMHTCSQATDTVPLGSPMNGVAVYLLDAQLNPVAQGKTGELYLSSVGLARGYLNEPSLTDKHFIPNPFKDGFSGRLYRTGDICRLNANGSLEWMGREDNQIKVAGVRIELGEVEHSLRDHPQLQEAVVLYHYEKNAIHAYVQPSAATKPNISQIRSYLESLLPSYMIPARFMYVDSFAITANGKIDRNLLPPIDDMRPELESSYTAPRNELEQALSNIWSEILHLDKVGIYDNFFELGGQSLMATQIVSRIRSYLGMEIPLYVIFGAKPTIEQTASAIEQYQLEQIDSSELEKMLLELEQLERN